MKKFYLNVLIFLLLFITLTVGCSTKDPVKPVDNQIVDSIEHPTANSGNTNKVDEEINTTETTTITTPINKSDVNNTNNDTNVMIASQMAGFFDDLQAVNNYYDNNLTAMAKVKLDVSKVTTNTNDSLLVDIKSILRNQFLGSIVHAQYTSNVPKEFTQPISSKGTIPAPSGACPAAAKPTVSFTTASGKTVTPELLTNKNIKTIPTDIVTMDQNTSGSLTSVIENMVKMGDQSLATSEGWNTMLWNNLESIQTPASSMLDYQLWNASKDIEQEIANLYLKKLQAMNVPPIVIDAFNKSNKTGWFASAQPTKEDALTTMNIEAQMTGSVNGTVYEQRNFSIPGAGKTPIFGTQTGNGTVVWNHPELGPMSFEVDILLDKFDSMGRAIGGTVEATDAINGYKIIFFFKTDGSKEGKLYKGDEYVGQLTMTTNAEKFENYIDVKTNQSTSLNLQ